MKRYTVHFIYEVVATSLLFVLTWAAVTAAMNRCSKEPIESQPVYLDSTQVKVIYTDTWGKILILKEE